MQCRIFLTRVNVKSLNQIKIAIKYNSLQFMHK